MSHLTCRLCASCHCHDCVMQEREVKRQAIQSLIDERDEAREVARLAVTTWHWHQEAGHPPGMGYDELTIQQLYKEHPWLKEEEQG